MGRAGDGRGRARPQLSPSRSPGGTMGPLEGYRVIDFGWVYAGPVVGALLADMGAEVIKVETRHRTDTSRRGRPITGENIVAGDAGLEPDIIPLFHCLNRNKLGITVDMNQPAGVAILKRLVATADVV